MFQKIPLLILGINQTLVFSLLPFISEQFPNFSTGALLAALNASLLTHWLGSGWWGKKLKHSALSAVSQISILGYLASHLAFVCILFWGFENIIWIALTRLCVGAFGSAFMPVAQTRHMVDQSVHKLSKVSGIVTIGRLVGPVLVLLPIPVGVILIVPALALVASFINLILSKTEHYEHELNISTLSSSKAVALKNKPLLILAACVTALTGTFYIMLLGYLGQINQTDLPTKELLAKMMLGVSAMLIVHQFFIIPNLIKRRIAYFSSVIFALIATALCIGFFEPNWISLAVSVFCLAFAIAGLPAWYTGIAFGKHPESQSIISGLVAQAHTIGQLCGTGLSILCLLIGANITFLTCAILTSVMLMVIVFTRKHQWLQARE